MRLLDRYLLRQYLATVFYCLAGFVMVHVIFDLFSNFGRFLKHDIPALRVLQYYGAYVAPAFEFVLPASLLLATLYTLWQLSRHGELTAIRAGGISLTRIMLPFLAVGVLVSLATAIFNETVVPGAAQWARELKQNEFRERDTREVANLAHYNPRERRLWRVDRIDLKQPDRLYGVKVTRETADGNLAREWFATRGEWLDGRWWFYDVAVQDYNPQGHPVGDAAPVPGSELGMEMPFRTETPRDFVNEVKPWEFMSVRDMLDYLAQHPQISPGALARKRVDLHLRLAMPWACFIVILFGIPAGVRGARESIAAAVLLTLLAFFMFYALTQVGAFCGKRQLVTPWLGAWLPNVVFCAAGLRMLYTIR